MGRIQYTPNNVYGIPEEEMNDESYLMPKFFFEDGFKKISSAAKLLYSLLLNLTELSRQNSLYNENKELYFIMPYEEMAEILRISMPRLKKTINDLKDADLLDEEIREKGEPNRFYIKLPD